MCWINNTTLFFYENDVTNIIYNLAIYYSNAKFLISSIYVINIIVYDHIVIR